MVDLTHFGAKRVEKKKPSLTELVFDKKKEGYKKAMISRAKIEKKKRLEELLAEVHEDKRRFEFELKGPLSINRYLDQVQPLFRKYDIHKKGSIASEFYLIKKFLEDDEESKDLIELVEKEINEIMEQLKYYRSKNFIQDLVDLFWQMCHMHHLNCRQYHFPLVNMRPTIKCKHYEYIPAPFIGPVDPADVYHLVLGALDVINDIFDKSEIEASEIERFVNEVKKSFISWNATGIRVFKVNGWFVLLVLNWC